MQAKSLQSHMPIDMVLSLKVPFSVIIDRIKGRFVHPGSGRIYHTEFNPPKNPGLDDVTGEKLIKRDDDKEETMRKRLQDFEAETKPVLEYYR